MMYLDKAHPDVLFDDIRSETITVTDRSHGKQDGTRTIHIEPDTLMDFRDLPFADGTFKLVFKWNETQVKVKEVLDLAPIAPLFGYISGRKGLTHWLVFMKPAKAGE